MLLTALVLAQSSRDSRELEVMQPLPRPIRHPPRCFLRAELRLQLMPGGEAFTEAPFDPAPIPVRSRLRTQTLLLVGR